MSEVPQTGLDNAQLAEAYGALWSRCVTLGRGLTEAQASTMSPCCPDWSVKDLFAHLVGVPSDILIGNIEGAATVEWADAQVAVRASASLAEICDEYEDKGFQVQKLVGEIGTTIMPQFYLDAWTHEWDVRHAVGAAASPDLRLVGHTEQFLHDRLSDRNGGKPLDVEIDLFTLCRVVMGRRSIAQIEALGLDPEVVILWSPNPVDIEDPVLD